QRGHDLNVAFLRACFHHRIESAVIGWAAIRVARTVGLNRTNVHLFRAQHLGPTNGYREEMRVAEGDVGDWNAVSNGFGSGNRDRAVGECRSADGAERLVSDHEFVANV